MSQPGLRERRKQKTRWAIQEHALRLFAEHGYDATTVEQIAAAAEISPSTFFRYFATKEDVVIVDRYDPMMIEAIVHAPTELGPVAALRHALRTAMAAIPAEELDQVRLRVRLVFAVPALRARSVDNILGTVDALAPSVAGRMGRDPDDLAVRSLVGACIGALIPIIPVWAAAEHRTDLAGMVDEALAALDQPAPPVRRGGGRR